MVCNSEYIERDSVRSSVCVAISQRVIHCSVKSITSSRSLSESTEGLVGLNPAPVGGWPSVQLLGNKIFAHDDRLS
jgi:hypothetical protein